MHSASRQNDGQQCNKKSLAYTQIGSANTMAQNAQNLLLPGVQDNSAIMTAMFTNSSLQLIVESFSTGANQVAPASIHNNSFKLIDELASKRASFAPYIFDDTLTYAEHESNHEGASCAQATSFQTSKLIDIYSKISLHFRKDCGIFCEGE